MSDFKFTREERLKLLGQVLPIIVAKAPTKYPPNKDGGQKHGTVDHVSAVWAWKFVSALEAVWQNQLDYEERNGPRESSSQGKTSNDAAF